ncbi:MAG: hypothetical protein ACOVSW_02370 [Candidatus Kapaibacteriota bacterium]|jgi:hypothetical protein
MRYLIQTEANVAFERIDAYLKRISVGGDIALGEAEHDDFRATALAIQEYEQMQYPRPTIVELLHRHGAELEEIM